MSGVIRRFEQSILRFEQFFGRTSDVFLDMKDRQVERISKVYDSQKSNLNWKVASKIVFTGASGACSIVNGSLSQPPKGRNAVDDQAALRLLTKVGSEVLPSVGNITETYLEGSNIATQKEQTLAQNEMQKLDQMIARLQQITQTYQSSMQRIQEQKSQARGG